MNLLNGLNNLKNCNYAYGCLGWYDANEVLTSIQDTVICIPKNK